MNKVLTSILSLCICALIVVGIVFAAGGFNHKSDGVEDIVPAQSAELEALQAQYEDLLQKNSALKDGINYMQNWKPWGQDGPVFGDISFSLDGRTVCDIECTSDDYVELRFEDTGAGKFLFPKFSIGGTVIDTYQTNDSGQVTTSVACYGIGNSELYVIKCADWATPMLVHVSPYLKYYDIDDGTGAKYYYIGIIGIPFNDTTDEIFTIESLYFASMVVLN